MLERFYPDREAESAYTIDYQGLYENGYRGVIFDIDNTLVPHGAPADEKAVLFFGKLREIGLQTVLLSNNKESRVKSFADAVGAKYLFKAGKPGRRGYERAMEVMGTEAESTFFVGDQPYLTEKSAEQFLVKMEEKQAVLGSVRCGDTVGNPTWFSREYREELLALTGDRGGRRILKKYPEEVVYYEIGDEGEIMDIDTLP